MNEFPLSYTLYASAVAEHECWSWILEHAMHLVHWYTYDAQFVRLASGTRIEYGFQSEAHLTQARYDFEQAIAKQEKVVVHYGLDFDIVASARNELPSCFCAPDVYHFTVQPGEAANFCPKHQLYYEKLPIRQCPECLSPLGFRDVLEILGVLWVYFCDGIRGKRGT